MFVYMLLCRDGSIYTGTARDLMKRMRDHFERTPAAAAYTRAKGAAQLLAAFECESLSLALRLEHAVKRLTREGKEALLADPRTPLSDRFPALADGRIARLPEEDPRLAAVRLAYNKKTP